MPIGEWDTQLLIDGKTQFADAACPSFIIADGGDQRVILGCAVEKDHTVHQAANGASWWQDSAGCWRHATGLTELNMGGARP